MAAAPQRLTAAEVIVVSVAQVVININTAVASLIRRRKRPRLPQRIPKFIKVLENDQECRLFCRMSVNEVVNLCALLVQDTLYAGHYKYSPLHRFTAFLIQMSHNYHYRQLRTDFDWAMICLNLNFWADQIVAVLDSDDSPDNICLWSQAEFRQFRRNPQVQLFPNCIGAVDSIFIQIYRPDERNQHSRFFSWYKDMDAVFFTVMCDRRGKIRYCDNGVPPRRQSDQASMSRTHLALPSDIFLLGDGHYREDSRCRAPYTYGQLASPLVSAADRQTMITYNKLLRSQRILIEWIFSRIRGHFGIFDVRFTYHVSQLPRAFRAACLLYNYLCRIHNNWPGVNMAYYVDAVRFEPDDADYVDAENIQPIPQEY